MKVCLSIHNIKKGMFIYRRIKGLEYDYFTTNFDDPNCLDTIEFYFNDYNDFHKIMTAIFPSCRYEMKVDSGRNEGMICDIDYSRDVRGDGTIGFKKTYQELFIILTKNEIK